jgi:hypothetical protein
VPEFAAHVAWPLAAGLGITALVDAAIGGDLLRRPLRGWLVHAALLTLAFCLGLLVFRRPWIAFCTMLVLQGVVIAVSLVKKRALNEPFVFQDVEYFIDALRHPRLYLPFFGLGKLALILAGVAAMIYASLRLEPDLAGQTGWPAFAGGSLLLTALAALALWLATRRPFAASFDPQADLRALGLSASLAGYAIAEKRPPALPDRFAGRPLPAPGAALPHIVAVQSESFFDARRLWPGIAGEVYAWLDEIRLESAAHGLLQVPAIGANTVRTEFAFLSGLSEEALGVHRFQPYRKLPWHGVRTLAHHLRGAGYRTVCIHPYVASFYRRDKVFPRFGFDDFVDERAFGDADRAGPFVGDVALGARVRALLESETSKPLFVFVITMENHGPLHLEQLSPAEAAGLFRAPPPAGLEDLGVYLRHVRNAGRMLQALRAALSTQARAGLLCWYGDHVPIMPSVYAHTGFADARTDYFIWQTSGSSRKDPRGTAQTRGAPPRIADLAAADLAAALLKV